MLSDALLTAVREVRADLFDSRAEQTRSQALVRHIGNHRSEAFQHLRGDNCRRLGRQNQQQTTMHGTHHTTNENRQWSERRQTILVTGTTPDYYYNYDYNNFNYYNLHQREQTVEWTPSDDTGHWNNTRLLLQLQQHYYNNNFNYYSLHHPTNDQRQWSKRRHMILVTGTTPAYYYCDYNDTATTTTGAATTTDSTANENKADTDQWSVKQYNLSSQLLLHYCCYHVYYNIYGYYYNCCCCFCYTNGAAATRVTFSIWV